VTVAYVESPLWDGLAVIAADNSLPVRTDSRAAICTAIARAAAENDDLVHISTVRPYLPAWVTPHMVGSVFSALHSNGTLRATGRYLPNGGTAGGNGSKPAKVSRLTRPIPSEVAA